MIINGKNPVIYWMESPHHTLITFLFWRFLEAEFMKYYFVFDYSAEDSSTAK